MMNRTGTLHKQHDYFFGKMTDCSVDITERRRYWDAMRLIDDELHCTSTGRTQEETWRLYLAAQLGVELGRRGGEFVPQIHDWRAFHDVLGSEVTMEEREVFVSSYQSGRRYFYEEEV